MLLRDPRTLKTDLKSLGQTCKEEVNAHTVRVVMEIGGRDRNIDGGGRGQAGEIARYGFWRNAQSG